MRDESVVMINTSTTNTLGRGKKRALCSKRNQIAPYTNGADSLIEQINNLNLGNIS